MDTATRVQNLEETDCISHSTNTLGKVEQSRKRSGASPAPTEKKPSGHPWLQSPTLLYNCLHTVKWFQVLLSNTKNSIQHNSFICIRTDGSKNCYEIQIIWIKRFSSIAILLENIIICSWRSKGANKRSARNWHPLWLVFKISSLEILTSWTIRWFEIIPIQGRPQ